MIVAWLAAVLIGTYVVYGFLVPSPYVRKFSGRFPSDEEVDGFLKPLEHFDPDEDMLAKRISSAIAADTMRLKRGAGVNDLSFQEPHWGHTTGHLQGKLTIDAVDSLPERFRVGLFAKVNSFSTVARIGFTKDPDLKFAVNRVALKLSYPTRVPNVYAESGAANELDLLFAEGEPTINGSGRQFFARDARQLDMAVSLKPPSAKTMKTILNWRNIALFLGVLKNVGRTMKPLRVPPANKVGWAGKPYFSAGPYALGEGAMKFCLVPKQTHALSEEINKVDNPFAVHKNAMVSWMAKGENAQFDLCIQLAKADCIPNPRADDPPKSVMAAEYCDLEWDENVSPYIKVGTLTLFASDGLNQTPSLSSLQFNAWNTLPEMRPLGQLFRIRKYAHAAHSNARVEHIFDETPGSMVGKCPFPH